MHGTYSLCYKLKMRQFKFLFENKNRDYVGINYYFFFMKVTVFQKQVREMALV